MYYKLPGSFSIKHQYMIDWGWYFHVRPTYLSYKCFIINIVFGDLWATMDTKFKVTYKIWISLLLTRSFEIRRRLYNLGSSLKRLLVVSRKRQITYWSWENTPGSTNVVDRLQEYLVYLLLSFVFLQFFWNWSSNIVFLSSSMNRFIFYFTSLMPI